MKVLIEITETLQKNILVECSEGKTPEDAIKLIKKLYKNTEIVLDGECCNNVEFEVRANSNIEEEMNQYLTKKEPDYKI